MTKPKDNSKLERDQSKEEMWASLWGAAGRWELAAHRPQSADAPRDGTTHPNTNTSTGLSLVSATEVTLRRVASNVTEQDPRNTQESRGTQTEGVGTAQGQKERQKTNDPYKDRTWQSNTQTSKNTLEGWANTGNRRSKHSTLSLRDTGECHSKNKLAQKTDSWD